MSTGADGGLDHPEDLAAWHRWQERRQPLRAVRGRLRSAPVHGVLTLGGPDPDLLVVLESTSPSNRSALLGPVAELPQERVAVLSPGPLDELLPGEGWTQRRWAGEPLPTVRAALSAGHYLPLGAAAHAHAVATGATAYVAQHGLLTPANPPLPHGAVALAWSAADGRFWASGRDDVRVEVVGSELLARAADAPPADQGGGPPTYLGQLHAAELPRRSLVAAAEAFCRREGATYRPHPGEHDRRSRRQHARWEGLGVHVDRSGRPLADLTGGVVAVFSTGVLEAAARGLPAWVDHPDPPPWLTDFWQRYGMHRWGEEPTPAPPRPRERPAAVVADVVGGGR